MNLLQRIQQSKYMIAIVGTLMVLWLGYNTLKVTLKNYELVKEINQLEDEIDLLALQNDNLKFEVEYFKTDDYLEIEARDKLGKVSAGERILVLPDNRYDSLLAGTGGNDPGSQPTTITNLNAWKDFLFGSSTR